MKTTSYNRLEGQKPCQDPARGARTPRIGLCGALIALLIAFLALPWPAEGTDVQVFARDFVSGAPKNRQVTVTLTDPTGPVVAGPWMITGDSVSLRTDATGSCTFSNMLALGGYTMSIAGNPSRDFPFTLWNTNGGLVNVVKLIGTNATVDLFYTATQVDALLSGLSGGPGNFVKQGTNTLMTTNANVVTVNGLTDTNVVDALAAAVELSNRIDVAAGARVAVVTNGALRTVSALDQSQVILSESGIDTNAQAYCDAVGVFPKKDRDKVSAFCRAIQSAGLWPHLVDAGLLRSNLNGGTTRTLFLGYGTNIGSPYLTDEGLNLDGISTAAVWPVRALTNHTVIVALRGTTNQPAGFDSPWTLSSQGGLTDAGENVYFGNNFGAIGNVYTRQGASFQAYTVFAGGFGATNQGWTSNERHYKTVGITYNGTTAGGYVDGLLSQAGAAQQTTSPLTAFCFGGRTMASLATCDIWWAGVASTWVIFDTVLTYDQAHKVETALRWLEPWDENFVVIGDSISANNYLNPDINWPDQFMLSDAGTNRYRIYDMAINGISAYTWSYGGNLLSNAQFLGPSGPVKKTTAVVYLGINDILGAEADATTEMSLAAIWKTLDTWGFDVTAATIHPIFTNVAIPWSLAMEQSRSNVNNWVVNRGVTNNTYHGLIRNDALFGDNEMNTNNAATVSVDGVHFTGPGFARIAGAVAGYAPPNAADGSTVYTYTNLYATDNSRAYYGGIEYVRSNGAWVLPSVPLASLRRDLATIGQLLSWNGNVWAPTSSVVLGGTLSVGGFTNRATGTNVVVTTDANGNQGQGLVIGPGLLSDGTTLSAVVASTSYIDNATNQLARANTNLWAPIAASINATNYTITATNQLAIANSNHWDPLGAALTATNQLAIANTNLWDPLGIALTATNQLAKANTNLWDPLGIAQAATNQLAISDTNHWDPLGIAQAATNQLAIVNTNRWDPLGIAQAATNQLAISDTNHWDPLGIAQAATNQLAISDTNRWDPLGQATLATNQLAIVNTNRWDPLGIALTATNQLARANTNLWDPLGAALNATNKLKTDLMVIISDASNHMALIQGTNVVLTTNVANGVTAVTVNATGTGTGGTVAAGAGIAVATSGTTNTVSLQDPLSVGELDIAQLNVTNFTGTLSSSTNVAPGGNVGDALVRSATGNGMAWQGAFNYLNVSNTTVEVPVLTNGHALYSTNNLFIDSTVEVSGPTNFLSLHWDTFFRSGSFSFSNNIASNASGFWMGARWATNGSGANSAVLYLKAGLTNEDASMIVKSTDVFGTNGLFSLGGGSDEIADTFSDAGAPLNLTNHLTTTGGYTWLNMSDDIQVTAAGTVTNVSPGVDSISGAYVSHTMSSANYTATLDVTNWVGTAAASEVSLGIRYNGLFGANRSMYFVSYLPDLGACRLYKVLVGNVTQLGADYTGVARQSVTNIAIVANGSTITATVNTLGGSTMTATDTQISAAGFVMLGSAARGSRDFGGWVCDNLHAKQ